MRVQITELAEFLAELGRHARGALVVGDIVRIEKLRRRRGSFPLYEFFVSLTYAVGFEGRQHHAYIVRIDYKCGSLDPDDAAQAEVVNRRIACVEKEVTEYAEKIGLQVRPGVYVADSQTGTGSGEQ